MSLDDDTIRRALPELHTLIEGVISVANLPRTGADAFDAHLLPLVQLCQEITELHQRNSPPLAVYLIALAAAARIPRNMCAPSIAGRTND